VADSRYWRRPGRRDEERARFNHLVRKLERYRLREGTRQRVTNILAKRRMLSFEQAIEIKKTMRRKSL
jgi:hypothetical protein